MTQTDKQHIHIPITTSGRTALEHLYQAVNADNPSPAISKQQLKDAALKGAIWLTPCPSNTHKPHKTERLRRLKKVLAPNDQLDFYSDPKLLNTDPAPPTLIADFEQYSVWLKPRGMLSQGSKWADHTALYRWVEMHYKPNNQSRPCWIVHRLDRATCGLMLLAHSKKMATTLSQLFEQKRIQKGYQANVWGRFTDSPQTFNTPVQAKTAISHVQLLEIFYPPSRTEQPVISRVRITIETGRKHQIRTHLSQAGYPIVGDRLYGDDKGGEKKTYPIYLKMQFFESVCNHNTALQLLRIASYSLQPVPCLEIPARLKIPAFSSRLGIDLQLTAYQLAFKCPITQTQQQFCLSEPQLNLHRFDSESE